MASTSSNQRDELIRKYLQNELSEEEERAFGKIRRDDPSFAEEVEAAVFIAARHRLDRKKHWRALVERKAVTGLRVVHRRTVLQWVAAAVFLLTMGVALWLFLPQDSVATIVEAELAVRYPSPVVVMGDVEEENEDWRAAVKAYQEGRYELAIPLLEKLTDKNPEDAKIHFYLGLSYLYAKEPNAQQAITYLEKSKQLAPVQFAAQADWFIALAWLWLGEQEKAVPILEVIAKSGGWKSEAAREIMDGF